MIIIVAALIGLLLAIGLVVRMQRMQEQRQMQRQRLRRWVTQHKSLDLDLRHWVLDLSEPETQVLLELLTGYCASINTQLDWIFSSKIANAPVLKSELEASVSIYLQTIFHFLQLEEDVIAFQAFLAFDKKPAARRQRRLVDQLYTNIKSQGPTESAKRLIQRFRPKKISRLEKIATIRQAFDNDPAATMTALKEIIADGNPKSVKSSSGESRLGSMHTSPQAVS